MIVDTYTLTIESDRDDAAACLMRNLQAVFAEPALREAEENITDLLPDGYRAVITHWTGSEER